MPTSEPVAQPKPAASQSLKLAGIGFLIGLAVIVVVVTTVVVTGLTPGDSKIATPEGSDPALYAAVVDVVGKQRARNAVIDSDGVIINFTIQDNLTDGLRNFGLARDVVDLLATVHGTVKGSYGVVELAGWSRAVDRFGNETERAFMRARWDQSTLAQVNFEGYQTGPVDRSRIYDLASSRNIDQGFR